MNYTWGEIQIETCKKMFLNNTNIDTSQLKTLKEDNKYKVYFNGMAQAANEGIAELVKRGKPYIKTFTFTKQTKDNLLGNMLKTITHYDEDLVFETEEGQAYYFEVDNGASIDIYVGEDLVESIETPANEIGTFEVYKDFLYNEDKKPIKIVFGGKNPYNIRNICIYKQNYNYGESDNVDFIPNYSVNHVFNLKEIIPDFYKIYKFYYEGHELIQNTDYKFSDHYTLILDDMEDGQYQIKYQCYPEKITEKTPKEYVLPLEFEVAAILPLYMASELYKDDDISLSTIYRNEFETAIENLYPKDSDLKFVSKSGWL